MAGDWALPLIDRDEPRFAEASREMLQREDFIVPYFNDQTRFDKPPLIYWLQDAAYKIFGENEFAARLPSGVCGALTTVIIAVWGSQLFDPKTGWRAALMFGLCLQAMVHAHAAVADMAMIAACTGLRMRGMELAEGGERAGCREDTGLVAGFLGAAGGRLPGEGADRVGADRDGGMDGGELERGKRPGFAGWMGGIVLMLALVGIWGIPALIQTHGQYAVVGLGKHVVMRSVSTPLEGHGAKTWWSYVATFPFYFATVWPSFFPWSLWLPGMVAGLWARRKEWRLEESYLVTGDGAGIRDFHAEPDEAAALYAAGVPLPGAAPGGLVGDGAGAAFQWMTRGMAALALLVGMAALPMARPLFVSQQLYDAAAPWLSRPMELGTVAYHEPVWCGFSAEKSADTRQA